MMILRRAVLQRQRTTVGEGAAAANKKPPAWDLKGRLELMEGRFK